MSLQEIVDENRTSSPIFLDEENDRELQAALASSFQMEETYPDQNRDAERPVSIHDQFDLDIEKALALSLQAEQSNADRNSDFGHSISTPLEDDDPDIRAALESSLQTPENESANSSETHVEPLAFNSINTPDHGRSSKILWH